jgi:nucleotide-binding universal stress UspA family protein
MTILVAFAHTAEGHAALEHARRLAANDNAPLVVFDMETASAENDRSLTPPAEATDPAESTLKSVRWLGHRREDPDPAAELIDLSEELEVDLIVVGLRRRSRVGKLLLGSNAQRILIDAEVPVLAVKATHHDQ